MTHLEPQRCPACLLKKDAGRFVCALCGGSGLLPESHRKTASPVMESSIGDLKTVLYGALAGLAGGLVIGFFFFILLLGLVFGGEPSWQITAVTLLMVLSPVAGLLGGLFVAVYSQADPKGSGKSTRRCPKCGRYTSARNEYCTACGSSLGRSSAK